jgi:uncharacterized membrane protein YdbT with pleckstrin-like domain
MGYVEEHLDKDERVIHRGALHPIVYVGPLIIAAPGAFLLVAAFGSKSGAVGVFSLLFFLPFALTVLSVQSAEFAVTTKRVIMKYGIIQRHSLELLLQKIEGAKVQQGILGRMFDYGTVIVNGTGGTHEPFRLMNAPMDFRKHVLAQISARDSAAASRQAAPTPVPVASAESRERVERDCPHCAEPILEKAKVCKHCGRDVAPAA